MPGMERHGSQDSDVNAAPSLRLYAGSPRRSNFPGCRWISTWPRANARGSTLLLATLFQIAVKGPPYRDDLHEPLVRFNVVDPLGRHYDPNLAATPVTGSRDSGNRRQHVG